MKIFSQLGNDRLIPYLLILPSTLFIFIVFLIPVFETIILAFRDFDNNWSTENFIIAAEDINFTPSLRNTMLLLVAVVGVQTCLALGMAMMLTKMKRGRNIYLYIWTIPLGISDLAGGLVWLALLTESGYINSMLYHLGIIDKPTLWLSYESPIILFAAIAIAEIWRSTAVVMVILVAGVQLIPKEYNEAAQVFGASAWQRFVKVTLPLLKPSIQTALILRTILALEVFAVVIALAGNDFRVLVQETYLWQFHYRDSGVAAVYALLIFALSVAATLFYLSVIRVKKEAQTT